MKLRTADVTGEEEIKNKIKYKSKHMKKKTPKQDH